MNSNELIYVVTRAQAGDKDALNQLFNEYYNSVYYFALKTVRDERLAENITQETFVQVITSIKSLRNPAFFGSWLRSVTYNRCSVYFNKSKEILSGDDGVFEELREDNSRFVPEQALDQAEFRRTVMDIIDELTDEQRATVLMYYFDELSVKQIAAIQGISENTVKSRLAYARKHIRSAVEEYETRHGVKLHAALLPILYWVFSTEISLIPATTAVGVASGVTVATGIGLKVGTSTQIASATGAGVQNATVNVAAKNVAQDAVRMSAKKASEKAAVEIAKTTAKTAAKSAAAKVGTGVAAKAGMSLGAKIAAGVLAAVLAGGAAVGTAVAVKNRQENKATDTTETTVEITETVDKTEETEEQTESIFDDTPVITDDRSEYWQEFVDGGKHLDFIDTDELYDIDASNFEYTIFDIDKDGIYELLIQKSEGLSSFYNTWVFSTDGGEANLIFNNFGYGMFRYSSKYNALLVSPEFRPFNGCASNPFYELKDGELVFKFDVGENDTGYIISDGNMVESIDDTSEYFEDAEHLEWTEITKSPIPESGEHPYLGIIKDYEERYGEISFISDPYFYNNITGLVYADLIDFDADGVDELLLCYDIDPDIDGDIYVDGGLRYCIYTLEDNEVQLIVEEKATIFGNGGVEFAVPIAKRGDKHYIVEESFEDPAYYYKTAMKTLIDGRLKKESEFGMAPIEDFSQEPTYLIDGEECSGDEYAVYSAEWLQHIIVLFNGEEVLEENKKTILRTKELLGG